MKKSTIILLVSLILIGLFLGEINEFTGNALWSRLKKTPTTTLCKDSDGVSPNILGTVTYLGKTYTDKCLRTSKVSEAYCSANRLRYKTLSCPTGTICLDGACITQNTLQPTPKPVAQCNDSDGGRNEYNNGTASGKSVFPDEGYSSKIDYCIQKNEEGFFNLDQSLRDPYLVGKVESCTKNCAVHEYYCSEETIVADVISCPNGCSDGACVKTCIPIIENGPSSNKLDIIFIPDDYLSENELFSNDVFSFKTRVNKFIDYNSQYGGLFSKEPFKSNKNKFNVYMLNIKENKDCQIPDENGGDRWGCKVWAEEKAKLCTGHDSVVVLSDDLSGTGGQSGYAFTGMNFAQITPFSISKEEALKYPELFLDPWISTFVHEFGHSFSTLKDEYYTNDVFDNPSQFSNCDSFGCPKWCSGTPTLQEPQYEECSKITNQQECENANLNPPCTWIQLYGNYVCRGTFSYQNFGINCLGGELAYTKDGEIQLENYGCYQGCEGLNGYRSELGCNIMGGKCTGNEEKSLLEFSPRGKAIIKQIIANTF